MGRNNISGQVGQRQTEKRGQAGSQRVQAGRSPSSASTRRYNSKTHFLSRDQVPSPRTDRRQFFCRSRTHHIAKISERLVIVVDVGPDGRLVLLVLDDVGHGEGRDEEEEEEARSVIRALPVR